jgi:K+-transporting ATPase ATPase A chain
MLTSYWLQIAIFFLLLITATKYLGIHICKVLSFDEKPFLYPIISPFEKITYKILRIDTSKEHNWKQYLTSVLILIGMGMIFMMIILLNQHYLPLNPQGFSAPSFSLALSIAVGFATNTDWQCYPGESTLSAFSQMTALTVQNFISPAIALAVCAAFVRGLKARERPLLGNFWVDVIRILYYILLPLSIILAIIFVYEGIPQNFLPYTQATTVEGAQQTIVQGPIASQEAIKILATNGGGYTNVNSAHPYENPTPLTNYIQSLFMLLIPAAQIYFFGRYVKNFKHAWSIFIAISMMLFAIIVIMTSSEASGNPFGILLSIDPSQGNLEGKDLRIGLFGSSLFSSISSSVSNGALSSNLDSYTPIGVMMSMINVQLGQTTFGGMGAGLHSLIILIFVLVYLSSLISGKTPEYFGKKIEIFDIKMSLISIFIYPTIILVFTACACSNIWGTEVLMNQGPRGFTELLYTFSSAANGNGSSLLGSATNTVAYNVAVSLAIIFGRIIVFFPVLALADSFSKKKYHYTPSSPVPISGMTFILLLIVTIMIFGGLCYIPGLIIGPIVENFMMNEGNLF